MWWLLCAGPVFNGPVLPGGPHVHTLVHTLVVSMVDIRDRQSRRREVGQEDVDTGPHRTSSLRKFLNMLPRRRARTHSGGAASEPGG